MRYYLIVRGKFGMWRFYVSAKRYGYSRYIEYTHWRNEAAHTKDYDKAKLLCKKLYKRFGIQFKIVDSGVSKKIGASNVLCWNKEKKKQNSRYKPNFYELYPEAKKEMPDSIRVEYEKSNKAYKQ